MGDTPGGRMARAISPTLILAIVVFMVLNQLKIAPAIVTTTYIALIGMLAVAGALAFGLGGRGLGADMVRGAAGWSGRANRPSGGGSHRRPRPAIAGWGRSAALSTKPHQACSSRGRPR